MHHFFVSPEAIRENRVVLRGATAHQIRDVLRMRPGDEIMLFDNTGWAYHVELGAIERDVVHGHVLDRAQWKTEALTRVTLYQGLLKGDKFEWVLQKGTELGIAEFVPVLAARSIVGNVEDIGDAKIERWQRIIVEAAEQSGRAALPTLARPMLFKQACQAARQQGLALIPWEEERSFRLRQALRDHASKHVSLMIGPEGGFAHEEVATAREAGVIPVTLGPRILRAETAGLAAAAAVFYELGDFG
jgi:16S rRNA (uracil1498-N3)-methyltransferase